MDDLIAQVRDGKAGALGRLHAEFGISRKALADAGANVQGKHLILKGRHDKERFDTAIARLRDVPAEAAPEFFPGPEVGL